MVRLPLLLLPLVALVSATPLPSEILLKVQNDLDTIGRINAHNANPNRTFNMKFSPISFLTPEEYTQRLGARRPDSPSNSAVMFQAPSDFVAPDEVDWRDHGAVSPVKDQGRCGSCWAFSAVGALEGQHAIKKKDGVLQFSEQNLVDCSTDKYYNDGCDGGMPNRAFDYVKDNEGIDTETSYPYHAHQETCHFSESDVGETDSGYVQVPSGDEEALKNAVARIGPISVAIDAEHDGFQHYKDGVYYDEDCTQNIDHAVLIVGYGTNPKGGDYWLVKNSWGSGWGDNGYIKMARNRDNHCAIASYAYYPVVGDSILLNKTIAL